MQPPGFLFRLWFSRWQRSPQTSFALVELVFWLQRINRRGERQGEIFLLNQKRAGTHQDRTAATSLSCPLPLGGWSRSAEAEPALRAERLAARPTPGESS